MNTDYILLVHYSNKIADSSMTSVAMSLAIHEHDVTGECFPSLERLAETTKLGVSTVQRAINRMVSLNLVAKIPTRKGQRQGSTRYRLNPEGWAAIRRVADDSQVVTTTSSDDSQVVTVTSQVVTMTGRTGHHDHRSSNLSSKRNKKEKGSDFLDSPKGQKPSSQEISSLAGKHVQPYTMIENQWVPFAKDESFLGSFDDYITDYLSKKLTVAKSQRIASQSGKARHATPVPMDNMVNVADSLENWIPQ